MEVAEKKKRMAPELRFGEFDYEWEYSTLEEVAKYRRGSFPQPYGLPEWYDDQGFPFVQVFDVDDDWRLKPNTKQRISEKAKALSVFAPKGTVVITLQGSIGRIAITQYDACVDRTLLLFQEFLKETDKRFFMYSVYLCFEIEKRQAPGGTIKTITKEVLSSFTIPVPSLPEQKKIADFLSAVDARIKHLGRKKELLEQYKKGVMQKLFAQELRFQRPDGTNYPDWEEKRLGDFTALVHGDGDWVLSENITAEGEYSLVQLGNIGLGKFVDKPFKKLTEENFATVKGTLIEEGDLLFNRMVDDNVYTCLFPFSGQYLTSVDVCWIRGCPEIDNTFLMNLFLLSGNQHKLLSLSSGSGRVRISKKNLFERFTFMLPSVEEQQKIADFLSALDKKIEAVSTQIAKTQQFKKGLLQKMFV